MIFLNNRMNKDNIIKEIKIDDNLILSIETAEICLYKIINNDVKIVLISMDRYGVHLYIDEEELNKINKIDSILIKYIINLYKNKLENKLYKENYFEFRNILLEIK